MQITIQEDNKELKIRKTIGREHLNANRIEDALAVFAGILRDYPEDVESLVILGDLYLASGDNNTAVQLYGRARQYQKEDIHIEQRLHLAQVEKDAATQSIAEMVPTHPEAVARLLQRLTGRVYPVEEIEIDRAVKLLATILHSPDPSQEVAQHLEEIDTLLPALIELNIRQARSNGRHDIAESLQDLQSSVHIQINPDGSPSFTQSNGKGLFEKLKPIFNGHALILVPSPQQPSSRSMLIADGLSNLGAEVKLSDVFYATQEFQPNIVIASNPHIYTKSMSALATASASSIPIIIDLDTDFEHMPQDHPNYQTHGLAAAAITRAYLSALLLANLVVVPSVNMASTLKNAGYPVMVIPDGWSNRSPLWNKRPPRRKRLKLGWIGQRGQLEDVTQIRRVIIRILREFPDTSLIISGDEKVYQLFDSVPTNRKRYHPEPTYEEFPNLLDQIDILMVPFRNTPYNRSQSDKILVEAGVKGIPWVASPIPSFLDWNTGGLIANSVDEWHAYLKRLVTEPDLRQTLRLAGIRHSEGREMEQLTTAWMNAIHFVQRKSPFIQPSEVNS